MECLIQSSASLLVSTFLVDVLWSTLKEASLCPMDDQLFRRPFDIEARALKILGDLLPFRSRGIRESHALCIAPSLDKEGRGPADRILLEFLHNMWWELSELEERIHLIDGTSHVMSEEECRRVIAARKFLKETGVAQWEFLEEALTKACSMARERMEVKLKQRWAEEQDEGIISELLSILDVKRVEWDEARDDTEGVSFAK
ncbi:hypothetical protein ACLOJK_014839 [Asimina triloba]